MIDQFKRLEQLISFANARHGVLSSNIANADTPNYKAMDIKFESLLDRAALELKTTHSKHAGSSSGLANGTNGDQPLLWGDGNNVEVDMEVAKMTENAMLLQAGVTLLSAKIRMFKNALRR